MEILNLGVLGLSGLMLSAVGAMRLVKPASSYCLQTYVGKPGIVLADDPDMKSEMRGIGAVTLLAGVAILAGVGLPAVRVTSFTVGALFFGGFGLGRVTGVVADGKPNKDLLNGLGAEVLFGMLHAVGLAMALA